MATDARGTVGAGTPNRPPHLTEIVRAFVALDLDPPSALRTAVARVPEHFHLTLHFFAELAPPAAGGVRRAMHAAAQGWPAFELELEGIGAFPGPGDPRVVWVGVGDGADRVVALQARLEDGLAAEGIPRERRPFRAHATLFRVRGPNDRARAVEALRAGPSVRFGRVPVAAITLYESRLAPGGADHRRLASASLPTAP